MNNHTRLLPTLDEVEQAARFIYETLPPTPQHCWPLLAKRAGVEVWLKHENHQATGAFKIRGGLVYLHELLQGDPRTAGVITATRGNHGQSIALAASRLGVKSIVVVPHGNSREKNLAMQAYGAELIEHGHDYSAAADFAAQKAQEERLHFVPAYHPWLIRGVATYWLELFRGVPDLDAVYVSIGMGSGISAAIAMRDALGLSTQVIGVISSQAPAYAHSLAAGEPVEQPSETKIADGLAVRRPNAQALEVVRQGAERIVQVTDLEIGDAMRMLFSDTHNVVEGAGAASLAALFQERDQMAGKRVGLILTGGNVDRDVYARVLTEE